jgi:hypothetical protein
VRSITAFTVCLLVSFQRFIISMSRQPAESSQLSTFLRRENEILIIAAAIGEHLPQRFEESLRQADDALLAPLASNDLHLADLVGRVDVAPAKRQHFGDSPARD